MESKQNHGIEWNRIFYKLNKMGTAATDRANRSHNHKHKSPLVSLLEKIAVAKRTANNKELACKIGFSTTTLFMITSGETKNLSAKNKQKLANFLKIPVFEIEDYLQGTLPIEAALRNIEHIQPVSFPTAEQMSLQVTQRFYTTILPYLLPQHLYEISLRAAEELLKINRNYRVIFMKKEDMIE